MNKLGYILAAIGFIFILTAAVDRFLNFLPESLNSSYLLITGTVLTASGVVLRRKKSLD
jgi:uncharacterized membrane protein